MTANNLPEAVREHVSKSARLITDENIQYRKVEDGDRVIAAIRGAEGKRLVYKEPANRTG